MDGHRLPYFDYLLAELGKQNPLVEKTFGRHVHWGYWEDPKNAVCDDDDFARAAERLTAELCGLVGITEGESVLDAGCGFGGTTAFLNERFGSLDLTGLNIDARQLERARQIVRPLRGNRVEFVEGDACRLPFKDASFDRVLAVECIFHFPSREAFFAEASRVLKPGGVLALSDFVPTLMFAPANWLVSSKWFEKYNVFGRTNLDYTVAKYRRLASQSGFASAAERNVSLQTLPTYRYLDRALTRHGAVGGLVKFGSSLIRLQMMFGVYGLPNYYLLSFRKRDAPAGSA
jgi:ubiquinone/menaquinone biosynthesis C-methylase UbiE